MAEFVDNWLITSCCGTQDPDSDGVLDGGSLIVEVDNWINQPGLYIWNLPSQEIGTTGFFLETGQCYTIKQISDGNVAPTIDINDFDFESGPIPNATCADFDLTPCSCPYIYEVKPCCPDNGPQENPDQVNLTLSNLAYQPGVYVYNGLTPVELPGLELVIVPGQCYEITRTTEDPAFLLVSLDFSTANWTLTDKNAGCNDATLCADCEEPGVTYLKYEPCCEDLDTIYIQTNTFTAQNNVGDPSIVPVVDISAYLGVILYNGGFEATTPNGLIADKCYTVTLHTVGSEAAPAPQDYSEYTNLPFAPYESSFVQIGSCARQECDNCTPTVYSLYSCEGGTPLQTESDLSAYVGQYIQISTPGGETIPGCWLVQEFSPIDNVIDPNDPVSRAAYIGVNTTINAQTQPINFLDFCECDCLCYEVINYSGTFSYIDCETSETVQVFSSGADKFCSRGRPAIAGKEGIDYQLVIGDECVDNECLDKCFLLRNCNPTQYPNQDATISSTLQTLSQYVATGEVIVLSEYEGCWTVEDSSCVCITVTINGVDYVANYQGTINDDNKVYEFEISGIAYYIWWKEDAGLWIISDSLATTSGPGLIGYVTFYDLCPTFSNVEWTKNLLPDGTNVTTLVTSLCSVQCDCPQDLIITQEYETCEDCQGTTAYKLSNCEKINEVIYSTQDLSEYVGQVIKDDCACWVVEEIDYEPPSQITLTDFTAYEDCTTCLSTYYVLTDCNGEEDTIITSTNLSPYLGLFINIEGCNPCYEVSLYTDSAAPESIKEVIVSDSFPTCFECNQLPPRCSTVFNNSTEDRTFTYIDVNGNAQQTEIVKSGHFSLRYCVQKWEQSDSFIYNFYGDCTVFEDVAQREDCDCFNLRITDLNGDTFTYLAVHNGEFYNTERVWDVTVNGFEYKIWTTNSGAGGWACSAVVGGSFSIADPTVLGTIKSAVLDCPAGESESNPVVWQGGTIPGASSKAGSIIAPGGIISFVTNCPNLQVIKYAHCVQHFPNKRKVKPGYNTPICSADKYDKITCNFADIAYKKVLELRYGISNCCPEEDEKWLIKKELIELQALTDPDYTCDQIADCCGSPTSHCSCNS